MCKVASITKITDKTRDDCWVFMQLLGELISRGNNDGLGYASFDKQGNIFGERWLINQSAFKDLSQIKGINANKIDKIYSFFGETVKRNEAQSIILHTRMATCARGIQNTHPFVDNIDNPNVAIIHNGMISNDQEFVKKFSTCDSEVLAHLYEKYKVNADLKNINKIVDKIKGWYTVLSLSIDNDGRMIMDAVTDNGRLGSYFIKELNTRVYSSNSSDVKSIADALDMTTLDKEEYNADTAFRIDVLSGEQIEHIKLETSKVPIRQMTDAEWAALGIVSMDGNLSDEEFQFRFWRH